MRKDKLSYLQTWKTVITKLPPLPVALHELPCPEQRGGQRQLLSRESTVKVQETHLNTPTGPLKPPEPPGTGLDKFSTSPSELSQPLLQPTLIPL